jgi:OOP family OmpA-OmpF porin
MPVGYGSTQPIAGNETEDGKAQNRRIDFVVK